MSDSEYSSDDDEDYIPGEESEDEEAADTPEIIDTSPGSKTKQTKPAKANKAAAGRKKKGGIKLDSEEEELDEQSPSSAEHSEEETETLSDGKNEQNKVADKAKEEAIWAAFKTDVQPSSKSEPVSSSKGQKVGEVSAGKVEQTVTITKTYDFAGEEVRVTKTVAADSAEARKVQHEQENTKTTAPTPSVSTAGAAFSLGRQKRSGGGLGSVLGQLGKKAKMSTLEKSRLDWDNFKSKEGIAEDLKRHNKDGFLEKQDFLQRTDERQFETERRMREGIRKR